jgi:hypothetical protein
VLGSHLGHRLEEGDHGGDGLDNELDRDRVSWVTGYRGDVDNVSRDDRYRSWCGKPILDGERGQEDEVQGRFGGVACVLCHGAVNLE